GYNRSRMVTEDLVKEHPHENFIPFYELEELVSSQERPRKFLIMVKAGRPVDLVIDQLVPLLDEGDMILDGGNSFFEDTIRREKSLKERGFIILYRCPEREPDSVRHYAWRRQRPTAMLRLF
ncbi:MAG: NAD(P)-binding domain-containing protein, partial [Eisenbergiella sp.]